MTSFHVRKLSLRLGSRPDVHSCDCVRFQACGVWLTSPCPWILAVSLANDPYGRWPQVGRSLVTTLAHLCWLLLWKQGPFEAAVSCVEPLV